MINAQYFRTDLQLGIVCHVIQRSQSFDQRHKVSGSPRIVPGRSAETLLTTSTWKKLGTTNPGWHWNDPVLDMYSRAQYGKCFVLKYLQQMLVNAFRVFRKMQAEFDLESRFKHAIYRPAGFGEFYPSTWYVCLEPNLLLFDVVEVGLLETFEDKHWHICSTRMMFKSVSR